MDITTVGLDVAKQVFQVHGVDAHGQVVVRKQLRRKKGVEYLRNFPPVRWGWKLVAAVISGGCVSNRPNLGLRKGG
jgi:transposase